MGMEYVNKYRDQLTLNQGNTRKSYPEKPVSLGFNIEVATKLKCSWKWGSKWIESESN